MPPAPIYLDHAATTPVRPEVLEAMTPFFGPRFGNPSSTHRWGREARAALDEARERVAQCLHAAPDEICFTSGGTESDNLAVLGVLFAARESGRDHVVTAAAEHHAVLDVCRAAQKVFGFRCTVLPVDAQGRVSPEAVAEAADERTALVTVMHANNELGTFNPVSRIAEVAHSRGALFHTDAVQTLGALPISFESTGADLISISAHKIYGPKGVGVLALRGGVRLQALHLGGGQERQSVLRDAFVANLANRIPGACLNGDPVDRLPGNANVRLPGFDSETLLLALDFHGIAASAGSACSAGSIEPSHVLLATGMGMAAARSSVRFSLGRSTTEAELDRVVDVLAERAGSR